MAEIEDANQRMLMSAAQVRPVKLPEVIKIHRRRFPFRGWVEIDSGLCDPFTVFCNNDDAVALDTLWNGRFRYEPGTLAVWAKLARRSRTVVDVGAHVGYFSLVAASTAPRTKVIAFEPVSHIFARLSVNLRANAAKNLQVLPYAVSDRTGWADIHVRSNSSLLSTGSSLEADDERLGETQKVPLTTLDRHFEDVPIDLVKMDVEGHELTALAGAVTVLDRDRCPVVLEVLRGTDIGELLAVLDPIGYVGTWIDENDSSLHPLNRRNPLDKPSGSRNVIFSHPDRPVA